MTSNNKKNIYQWILYILKLWHLYDKHLYNDFYDKWCYDIFFHYNDQSYYASLWHKYLIYLNYDTFMTSNDDQPYYALLWQMTLFIPGVWHFYDKWCMAASLKVIINHSVHFYDNQY